MKNKTVIIFGICFILIIVALLLVFKNNNKSNFNDLSIYKRDYSEIYNDNNKININDTEKTTIINYLKKEKFDRISNDCAITGIYMIKYDNVEISFDNNGCGVHYTNIHTEENYNTDISEEFKNYIINIID